MSSKLFRRGGAGLALLTGLVLASLASAQNCDCQKDCCPPYFKYRFEGPPKIKFKHGCPKPICDPCHLPHFGYYQTCWQPWPFPPDWSHCPVPPPAALVQPVPPKRFRGEPTTDDKDRDPSTAPSPRREGAATPQYLPSPMPATTETPAAVGAANPKPLPSGAIDQAMSHEPRPEPSLPLPVDPVPPMPAVVKPPEKHEETPVLAPMTTKTEETPSRLPDSLTSRITDPKPPEVPPTATKAGMRMVNSRRILLDYDLKDIPAPENSVLELWYTLDGKRWFKDDTQIKSGAPYVIEVNKEGTYGFMMMARNKSEKSMPPAPGEEPQVWVEVDWTKPVVHLVDARAEKGPQGRVVQVLWTAADSNLSRKPITLSYSEKAEGPWKTFAAELDNTGRYSWQVPDNVPANVFVRLQAADLVGNIGAAQSTVPVQLP